MPTAARLTLLRPIYIIGSRNRGVIESYRKNAVKFLGRNPRRPLSHEEEVATAFERALRTEMPGAYNARLNSAGWQPQPGSASALSAAL